MSSSRATLIQVAERAGVSLASTSRALHGGGASAAMVERVRAAAAELGYSPDAIGRSLRMKKTFQVAFAVADIGNPVYVEMMTAIHEALAPHGYRVVVMSTGDSTTTTTELVRSLSGGFVDGMILVPLRTDDALIEAVREQEVPVVVVGRPLGDHGIDSVSTDSVDGIGQAVRHLQEMGRRRIGFVNGPLDTTPGEARQRGFEAATQGSDVVRAEVAEDFTVTAGVLAAGRLLGAGAGDGEQFDAVVAANDLLAIAVSRAAGQRGLTVPGDLAVTGMDDTMFGRVFQPSLTSVSLGSAERGRAAARIMLRRVQGHDDDTQHVHVGPELIVRESTDPAADPAAIALETAVDTTDEPAATADPTAIEDTP